MFSDFWGARFWFLVGGSVSIGRLSSPVFLKDASRRDASIETRVVVFREVPTPLWEKVQKWPAKANTVHRP